MFFLLYLLNIKGGRGGRKDVRGGGRGGWERERRKKSRKRGDCFKMKNIEIYLVVKIMNFYVKNNIIIFFCFFFGFYFVRIIIFFSWFGLNKNVFGIILLLFEKYIIKNLEVR